MKREWGWKERRKIKNNKEKTKRKQKGFRLKSETLKKEKTEQKQKGLQTASGRP